MLSPFECLFGTKPDLTSLKIFGCKAFASTLVANRKKLDPQARECVYLGVKPGTKGFIHFDINTSEIFVSRHVRFHEFSFPFMQIFTQSDPPQPPLSPSACAYYDSIFPQTSSPTMPYMHGNDLAPAASYPHSMSLLVPQPHVRHCTRTRKALSYLRDYH